MLRSASMLVPALAAAAVLSLVAGCGGDRSMSAEVRAAAVKVESDAYATLGYRLEWRGFPIMNRGTQVAAFEPLGDVVAVQETSSLVSVLDARSGVYRCSDQLANPITKFVGLVRDGNRLVSSSETDAYFLSLDTCTLVDRHPLHEVVTTRPVLVGQVLVYGTASGQIIGHLTSRAINLWANSVRGEISADPVRLGETSIVGIVSQSGDVLLLDAASASGQGRNQIRGGIAPTSGLAASETTLFVASLDQSLYAFDGLTARQMWRVRTDRPITARPAYHDGAVYCDIQSDGFTAFDAANGDRRWVAKGVTGTAVAMRNGRLVVWDKGTGTAVTLDPQSGQVIDRVRLSNVAFLRADGFADGALYLCSTNGVVTKLMPRS